MYIFINILVVSLLLSIVVNKFILVYPYILETQWTKFACEMLDKPFEKKRFINVYNFKCPLCGSNLLYKWDIPLFKYIVSPYVCSYCQNKVMYRNLVVTLLLVVGGEFIFHLNLSCVQQCMLYTLFILSIIISVIDYEYYLIPDALNLAYGVLGILYTSIISPFNVKTVVISCIILYVLLFLFTLLINTLNKKSNLGLGDIKLVAVVMLWISWKNIPIFFFISALTAFIHLIINKYISKNPEKDMKIPFGIHLCLSSFIIVMFGGYL